VDQIEGLGDETGRELAAHGVDREAAPAGVTEQCGDLAGGELAGLLLDDELHRGEVGCGALGLGAAIGGFGLALIVEVQIGGEVAGGDPAGGVAVEAVLGHLEGDAAAQRVVPGGLLVVAGGSQGCAHVGLLGGGFAALLGVGASRRATSGARVASSWLRLRATKASK
jgi:hypothetical protein